MDHGAHVDFPFAALQTTALMTSAFHGNIEAVTLLLTNHANVRALDMQKSTALGYAFGGIENAQSSCQGIAKYVQLETICMPVDLLANFNDIRLRSSP